MKAASLLLALASAGLVAAAAFDSVTLCKQQILLNPNPAQFCYGTLHAKPPATITSTLTGPTTTSTATSYRTVSTITNTVATVTAATPTVTSTSTVESTTYTYSIAGLGSFPTPANPDYDKRLLSLVSSFGQSIVDQACFAIVYGGKTPVVTTSVAGPTTTKTSTVLTSTTTSVTATVTPAASTVTATYTDVQTSTVTYSQTYDDRCNFDYYSDQQQNEGVISHDACADACANESQGGQCTTFGFEDFGNDGTGACYLAS